MNENARKKEEEQEEEEENYNCRVINNQIPKWPKEKGGIKWQYLSQKKKSVAIVLLSRRPQKGAANNMEDRLLKRD